MLKIIIKSFSNYVPTGRVSESISTSEESELGASNNAVFTALYTPLKTFLTMENKAVTKTAGGCSIMGALKSMMPKLLIFFFGASTSSMVPPSGSSKSSFLFFRVVCDSFDENSICL